MAEPEHNIDLKPMPVPQELEHANQSEEERTHVGYEVPATKVTLKLVMNALVCHPDL